MSNNWWADCSLRTSVALNNESRSVGVTGSPLLMAVQRRNKKTIVYFTSAQIFNILNGFYGSSINNNIYPLSFRHIKATPFFSFIDLWFYTASTQCVYLAKVRNFQCIVKFLIWRALLLFRRPFYYHFAAGAIELKHESCIPIWYV